MAASTRAARARSAAWATVLVGGLILLVVGIGGWPTVGDTSLGGVSVIAGIVLVLADAIWVARTSA